MIKLQCNVLNSARPRLSLGLVGAGGHVGGEDLVGVAVEVLAGSVVAHGGARVAVADGDLYVAQVYAERRARSTLCSDAARRIACTRGGSSSWVRVDSVSVRRFFQHVRRMSAAVMP